MALGTPHVILDCLNQGPVREDGMSGCSSGERCSQDSGVPRENSILQFIPWLNSVIRQCHEAPASEGSFHTTDDQPALNSAGRSSPVA